MVKVHFALFSGGSAFAVPKVLKFWHFARVELRPPRLSEWAEAQRGFNNLMASARAGKWKETTMKVTKTIHIEQRQRLTKKIRFRFRSV